MYQPVQVKNRKPPVLYGLWAMEFRRIIPSA